MVSFYKVTLTSFLLTTFVSPVFASATSQQEEIKREMEALAAQRVEYHNKLGIEHLATGNHAAAIAAFEKVIKTSPNPQFVDKYNYAIALKEGGRDADAFAVFSGILPTDISGVQSLLHSMPIASFKGEAMASHELILSAYTSAGVLAYNLGKFVVAMEYFLITDTIENSMQPPIVKEETKLFVALSSFNAGYESNNADDKKISFLYFRKYFDMNPKYVDLDMYVKGAKVAYDSGDAATSELWVRKVLDTLAVTHKIDEITRKNTLVQLVRSLGVNAYKTQKYADAYYFYKTLMIYEKSLNPTPMDFYNAGTMAHLSGHHADAIKWIEESLALNLPQDVKDSASIFINQSKAALHQ